MVWAGSSMRSIVCGALIIATPTVAEELGPVIEVPSDQYAIYHDMGTIKLNNGLVENWSVRVGKSDSWNTVILIDCKRAKFVGVSDDEVGPQKFPIETSKKPNVAFVDGSIKDYVAAYACEKAKR